MEVTIKQTRRFCENITVGDGCWEWQGFLDRPNTGGGGGGYGKIHWNRRQQFAHRVSYEWLVGPISPGLQVDHLCRNRRCVRPDHLEPVTRRENIIRGLGWGGINSRKQMCVHGHTYDIANTVLRRTEGGHRRCRKCVAAKSVREWAKKKQEAKP